MSSSVGVLSADKKIFRLRLNVGKVTDNPVFQFSRDNATLDYALLIYYNPLTALDPQGLMY